MEKLLEGSASRALRIALALLMGVSLTRTVSADDSGIPQKLLDHEARVRAAFTPAQKSRQAALEARVSSKMSVHDVVGLMHGSSSDEIMVCLMKYLKDCAKEIRENRKLKASFERQFLAAKANKLAQDNARIDAAMREAKQKAQNLMDGAMTGMIIGAVQGGVQTGAASADYSGRSHAPTGKAPASPSGAAQAAPSLPLQGPAAPGPRESGVTGLTVPVPVSVAAQRGIVVPTRTPTKTPAPLTKALPH